jgi:hypothetical protein
MIGKIFRLRYVKVFIIAQFLGIFLANIVEGIGNYENFLVRNVVILPITEKTSNYGMLMQKRLYEGLIEEEIFNVTTLKKINDYLKASNIKKNKSIDKNILNKLSKKFKPDLIIYGNINKIGEKHKATLKFYNAMRNEDIFRTTVNLDIDINDAVSEALEQFARRLPFKGYISEIRGNIVKVKIKEKDIPDSKVIRVIKVTDVIRLPIINEISEFKKEEIASIKINQINEDYLVGDILNKLPEEEISTYAMVDSEASLLSWDNLTKEREEISENVLDKEFDEWEERAQTKNQAEEKDLNFSELDVDIKNKNENYNMGTVKSLGVYEDNGVNNYQEKNISWTLGINSSLLKTNYSLLDSAGITLQQLPLNIFTFGVNSNIWFYKYFGIDILYMRGMSDYLVSIQGVGEENLGIKTNQIKTSTKARYFVPVYLEPEIGIKMGYEDFRLIFDNLYINENNASSFAFIPTNRYKKINTSAYLVFNIIKQLGVETSFTYYPYISMKEDPVITGINPKVKSYAFSTGLFFNIYKELTIDFSFTRSKISQSFEGQGARFLSNIENAREIYSMNNLELGVSYKFF